MASHGGSGSIQVHVDFPVAEMGFIMVAANVISMLLWVTCYHALKGASKLALYVVWALMLLGALAAFVVAGNAIMNGSIGETVNRAWQSRFVDNVLRAVYSSVPNLLNGNLAFANNGGQQPQPAGPNHSGTASKHALMLPTKGASIPSAAALAVGAVSATKQKSPPKDLFATQRRHAKLLFINLLFFFVIALLGLTFLWTVFHLLENYNKYYNDNAQLYRDAVQLISHRCRPQAMNAMTVFPAAGANPGTAEADVLHPDLHSAKQQMDLVYDIRNQQMLQAEQALNQICTVAREHANMNVPLKSKQQAVTELLRHLWPINWFACTPGDTSNSCHYAIFASLDYMTHSPMATAALHAHESGTPRPAVDVFSTPLQMINDLVRVVALGVMLGTILLVLLLMFCNRGAKYAMHMGVISILVLLTGTSLVWKAVLTLWIVVKLVAGCLLCVVFLMGPVLGILKYVASTRLVHNIEDRFRNSTAVPEKRNVSVQQTLNDHAVSDATGLFSTVAAGFVEQMATNFPNQMQDWMVHNGQVEGGTGGSRYYHTMPAARKVHSA